MTRRSQPVVLVLLLGIGFLLGPRPASAQVVVADGPGQPAAHALLHWFYGHIPTRYQARERFVVYPLTDTAMDAYLSAQDTGEDRDKDAGENGGSSSHADDGEIDGIFEERPPRITLRLPGRGTPDLDTFAHEYGHYVWFHLLSRDDRDQYASLYKHQKAAHRLITRYAEVNVEEGFAEAFARYVNAPAALRARDRASFEFLRTWPGTP